MVELSAGFRVQISAPYQSLAVMFTLGKTTVMLQGGISVKWAARYYLERGRQLGVVFGPLFLVATIDRPAAGRLVS